MKIKFYCCLLFIVILFSCRQQIRTSDKKTTQTANAKIDDTNAKRADLDKLENHPILSNKKTSDELLSQFFKQMVEVKKRLETASKIEANNLYDAYFEQNQATITKLTASEMDILEKFYNEDSATKDLIRKEGEKLSKYNLAFDEVGEGFVEIKTKPDFYHNIFKNYVTDDYQAFLAIKKDEEKVQYSADASLLISFKAIGDRIIVWENMITKYPKTKLINKINEIHQSYQTDYLFGLDNTATLEFPGSEKVYINPENITEFNRFINRHPQSPTTPLIKFFLENFKDKNIRNLIEAEQKKLQ